MSFYLSVSIGEIGFLILSNCREAVGVNEHTLLVARMEAVHAHAAALAAHDYQSALDANTHAAALDAYEQTKKNLLLL